MMVISYDYRSVRIENKYNLETAMSRFLDIRISLRIKQWNYKSIYGWFTRPEIDRAYMLIVIPRNPKPHKEQYNGPLSG